MYTLEGLKIAHLFCVGARGLGYLYTTAGGMCNRLTNERGSFSEVYLCTAYITEV
jgi:hypothetical protein